jgi:hypothetical protein
MRAHFRRFWSGVFVLGSSLAIASSSASAQGYGSLGGYWAASRYATPNVGDSSPMVIPYGGMFEGFMPSRMGGGSALSFRSRPTEAMGLSRTPFRLSPLLDGVSEMSGGMGGSRVGARGMSPLELRNAAGIGRAKGRGGMRPMSGAGGASVMPPSIGYPFRQPPRLVSPSTTGTGMSM